MNNNAKIDLFFDYICENFRDDSQDDSLQYCINNGYKLHAISLINSSGVIENENKKFMTAKIDHKKELKEIKEICKNAFIYICKDCNHHAFLEEEIDENEKLQCASCLSYDMQLDKK